MTLRLAPDLDAALATVASRENLSKQQLAAKAIEAYVTGQARRRAEALKRIVTEDAELLGRLAQ